MERPHLAAAQALIGQPGSRHLIPTPAAVLDLDAFEANLARMAERARRAGLALRPHAKSHKSAWIARKQMEAGAVGVCCAKLAEAEALAAEGVGAILVTSPVAGPANARRAARLAGQIPDFRIVVDHVDGVGELAATGAALQVLIDVDVGLGRTGVHDPDQAADVTRAILRHPNLTLLGVQAYGGHWQHVEGANSRAAYVADGMAKLAVVMAAVREAGGTTFIATGGGTGTFEADAAQGVLTEVQPGSYAFMDREYRDALGDDPDGAFRQALFVATTVISANHPKWVTVDAGLKSMSTDGPLPVLADPSLEGAAFRFFGDEHGMVSRAPRPPPPPRRPPRPDPRPHRPHHRPPRPPLGRPRRRPRSSDPGGCARGLAVAPTCAMLLFLFSPSPLPGAQRRGEERLASDLRGSRRRPHRPRAVSVRMGRCYATTGTWLLNKEAPSMQAAILRRRSPYRSGR
ncbi:alanine racemase [Phenylobacterium sp. J367]|uniref:alanine racemase n=1 Tax=Phenylobacterium sp. J367 TaxID=2898435 RepID=UPI002151DAEB|nr:alanine racemase [Phenylobacterium sp. J367]MCR5879171.1 alanine racemase [Phenylobacterium sp. J367]